MNAYETLKAALAEKSDLLNQLANAQAILAERDLRISVLDTELAAALNEIGLRDTQITEAAASLFAAQSLLDEAQKSHAALSETLNITVSEKEALEKIQRDLDQEVAASIADQLATLGFDAASLPPNSTSADASAAAIYEKWSGLTGAEKTNFYNANKAVLVRYDEQARQSGK